MTISPDQIRLLREWLKRDRSKRNRAGFVAYFVVSLARGVHSVNEGTVHPCHK